MSDCLDDCFLFQMANPHEPHFLKPLLPGFHNGVVNILSLFLLFICSHFVCLLNFVSIDLQTILVSFFSQHIQGKTNGKKWKLRSDASDQTWEVIQEGKAGDSPEVGKISRQHMTFKSVTFSSSNTKETWCYCLL